MSFNDDFDYKQKYEEVAEELEKALDFIREITHEKNELKKKYKANKNRMDGLVDMVKYLMSARNLC